MSDRREVEDAISCFLKKVKYAQEFTSALPDMAGSLRRLMQVAGKDTSDIVAAGIATGSTVNRWLAGSHIPNHTSQGNLVTFFRQGDMVNQSIDSDAHFLATVFQNIPYRVAILFLVDRKRLDSISQTDLRRLLWFVVESASIPSFNDIDKFLG